MKYLLCYDMDEPWNYAKWKEPSIIGKSLDTERKLVVASGCGEKGKSKVVITW